jgi:biopolymer transport protein ExbD
MDKHRLVTPLLASMVGLLLILSICAITSEKPASTGMHVPIIRFGVLPNEGCDAVNSRSIVISIKSDGSILINETHIPLGELKGRLTDIYTNRSVKLAFIMPDPDVTFGKFANAYDMVASSTQDLHIGLLSPQLVNAPAQCDSALDCDLFWPGTPTFHACLPALMPSASILRYQKPIPRR